MGSRKNWVTRAGARKTRNGRITTDLKGNRDSRGERSTCAGAGCAATAPACLAAARTLPLPLDKGLIQRSPSPSALSSLVPQSEVGRKGGCPQPALEHPALPEVAPRPVSMESVPQGHKQVTSYSRPLQLARTLFFLFISNLRP